MPLAYRARAQGLSQSVLGSTTTHSAKAPNLPQGGRNIFLVQVQLLHLDSDFGTLGLK